MSDSTSRTPGRKAPAAAAEASASSSRGTGGAGSFFRMERATNRGFATANSRGMELALTVAVFVAIGWFIDRQAGTSPVFTIVLSVLGFLGIGAKLWIGYDREMQEHEDAGVWNRPADGTKAVNLTPEPTPEPKRTIEL